MYGGVTGWGLVLKGSSLGALQVRLWEVYSLGTVRGFDMES